MTIMVTGGAGFVGANVIKELLSRGRKVVVYDASTDRSALREVLGHHADSLPFVQGDITALEQLLHTIQAHQVSQIVHLAFALTAVCEGNPPVAVHVNVHGMTAVLEACRLAGIRRLVWASSAAVFGGGYEDEDLIPNDAALRPRGMYGGMKALCERVAAHYHRAFGVDSIGLRFGVMCGPGMQRGANSVLIRMLTQNPAVGLPTEVRWGDDMVDWLWVGDAARAAAMALEVTSTQSRAFNISGDYRRIRDAAEFIRTLVPGVRVDVEPGRFGFAHKVDASAIAAEIGFRPEWTMERQLQECLNLERRRHGLSEIA